MKTSTYFHQRANEAGTQSSQILGNCVKGHGYLLNNCFKDKKYKHRANPIQATTLSE